MTKGNWVAPTCCSMTVNVILFILVIQSIMITVGNPFSFWLPEHVRSELEGKFKDIRNEELFWDFTETTLAEFVFADQHRMNANKTAVDLNLLNTFNQTIFAQESRGMKFSGGLRFLQKRVKKHGCKRKTTVPRYQTYFEDCFDNIYQQEIEDT